MENFEETKMISFKHLLLCSDENAGSYNIKRAINYPSDAVDILNTIYKMSRLPEEIFVAVFLDYKNEINGIAKISHGTVNMSLVSTRELFKNALAHNTTHLLIAHNHPSGDPKPSGKDIEVTDMVAHAGGIMDILLVDHIIIGGNQYHSFAENNLLKQYSNACLLFNK